MEKIGVPCQVFNGKIYRLYPGRRYFMSHRYTMHFVVWKYYNGVVPKGYHIHHKDENIWNNDISNLELKTINQHLSEHSKKHVKENPEWFKRFHTAGIEAAKSWHKSPEGHEWHKQQAAKQRLGKQDYGTSKCLICSKEFKKSIAHQKFCGPNCKAKDFRRRHKD